MAVQGVMSGSVITGQELKNLTAGEHWIAGFQERRQVQRSRGKAPARKKAAPASAK